MLWLMDTWFKQYIDCSSIHLKLCTFIMHQACIIKNLWHLSFSHTNTLSKSQNQMHQCSNLSHTNRYMVLTFIFIVKYTFTDQTFYTNSFFLSSQIPFSINHSFPFFFSLVSLWSIYLHLLQAPSLYKPITRNCHFSVISFFLSGAFLTFYLYPRLSVFTPVSIG